MVLENGRQVSEADIRAHERLQEDLARIVTKCERGITSKTGQPPSLHISVPQDNG